MIKKERKENDPYKVGLAIGFHLQLQLLSPIKIKLLCFIFTVF